MQLIINGMSFMAFVNYLCVRDFSGTQISKLFKIYTLFVNNSFVYSVFGGWGIVKLIIYLNLYKLIVVNQWKNQF